MHPGDIYADAEGFGNRIEVPLPDRWPYGGTLTIQAVVHPDVDLVPPLGFTTLSDDVFQREYSRVEPQDGYLEERNPEVVLSTSAAWSFIARWAVSS